MFKVLKSKYFWLVIAIGFLCFGSYLFYLNNIITSRFESRRWDLPSRVFSDTYSLYNNKVANISEINNRLTHLGYRKTEKTPNQAGMYCISNNLFEIYLHDFDYPHKTFKGFPISFEINNNKITNLKNILTNENISLANLEPELIASLFDKKMEDRTFVSLKEIPRKLTQAVILIEDERFYKHHGIDPIGIIRALFINMASGRFIQGGSTLTQQMVKNFFLTHEKTLTRKINEALMSVLIDFKYSKDEILEVYLNEIYFGQRGAASVTGVQEASRHYFSKNVSQLTASEAALLAGMIKAPGIYSPYANKEKAKNRRNLILKRLYQTKVIDKKEFDKAINSKLPLKQKQKRHINAPYFVEFVKKQLKDNFPVKLLKTEGLRIFTTLDMYQQRLAQKAVTEQLDKLENQRNPLKKNVAKGLFLEGAFISINPKTGYILSYVGGRDFTKNQYDIISSANRQPGSTFKPFAFLTAIDPNSTTPPFSATTLINDSPITLKTGAGNWKPNNYDKKFHGPVTVRQSLEKSYNVATVSLAQEVGLNKIIQTAKKAGITSPLQPFPSLVLGAFEVTPLELIKAYSIFPNNGTRVNPVAIRRVVTPDGEVLEKKSFEMDDVFSADGIYIMNKILQGVIDHGTGSSARMYGFDKLAAGKTGTTSDYKDSWFVGYTPDLLALSWVGYKEGQTTGLSGASGALPIWARFMAKATIGKLYSDFTPTPHIIILPIDKKTNLIHQKSCGPEFYSEYYIEGTEPTRFCHDKI